jgi:tetratricopeptide (TPR) repeat protein
MATSGPCVRELLDDGLRYEKAGVPERALECYRGALESTDDPALISESLRRQAHVYRMRCDWTLALAAAARAAEAAELAESAELLAEAWNAEATVYQTQGDFEPAAALYARMLETVPTGRIRGVALQNLAAIYGTQGRLLEAEDHFRQAYAAFEEADDRWGMGFVLTSLGGLALDRGDPARAEEVLAEATLAARETQDHELLAIARINYAEALLRQGDFEKAEVEASAAIGHFGAAENQWRRIECLRLLGEISLCRERIDAAGRFFQTALDIAELIGAKVEREQLRERLADLPLREVSTD